MEGEPGDLSTLLDHDLLQQALQEVSGLESFGNTREDFSPSFTSQESDVLVATKSDATCPTTTSSMPSLEATLVPPHAAPISAPSSRVTQIISHTSSNIVGGDDGGNSIAAITAAPPPHPVVTVPVNNHHHHHNRATAAGQLGTGLSQPLILVPSILPHGSIAILQPQVVATSTSQTIVQSAAVKRPGVQTLLPKPVQPKPLTQQQPPSAAFYPTTTFKLKSTSLAPMQHVIGTASMPNTQNLLPGTILQAQDPYLPMTKMTILPPGGGQVADTNTITSVLPVANVTEVQQQQQPTVKPQSANNSAKMDTSKQGNHTTSSPSTPAEKKTRSKRRKKLSSSKRKSTSTTNAKKKAAAKSGGTSDEMNNMPMITLAGPAAAIPTLKESTIDSKLKNANSEPNVDAKISNPSTTHHVETKVDLKEKYKANHISNYIPNYKTLPPKNDFSFAAFLKDVMKNRPRGPGRPKKPHSDEEKEHIKKMRAEMGISRNNVRALDLVDFAEKVSPKKVIDDNDIDNTDELNAIKCGITRSGRVSKPPKNTINNLRANGIRIESPSPPAPTAAAVAPTEVLATTGAITNMSFAPPPAVDVTSYAVGNRYHPKNARWTCKVCGKYYLGAKHVALHLKHFPDHSFNTQVVDTREEQQQKAFNPETWVQETEASTLLTLVGPKLFDSFSLWELLGKKVALKQMGTPEILSSIFADIQALVMDLKNMVDQCLTNVRINNDSFSVIFSPMISKILGQNGGGERFVLPYNQIPVHYHTLLGFPKGLKNGQPPDLLSPDSTNDIFPPEEENSQMSMASDTPERPLVEKVVLEANLGTREDIDEETQDSTRMIKRPRLDSESHSAASPPPPQTPDFLNHEDESNLSASSNIGKDLNLSEPTNIDEISVREFPETETKSNDLLANASNKDIITRTASQISNQSGRSIFTESTKTKLPSFSSIICGSPKSSIAAETADLRVEDSTSVNSPLLINSHHLGANAEKLDNSSKTLCLPGGGAQSISGSAPVSPGAADFVPALSGISASNSVGGQAFQRRSSVDQVLLCATSKLVNNSNPAQSFSPGKNGQSLDAFRDEQQQPSQPISTVPPSALCTDAVSVHSSMATDNHQLRRFSFESENLGDLIKDRPLPSITSPLRTTPCTNSFQTSSFSVYSTVSSPNHQHQQQSQQQQQELNINAANNLPMFLETPPRDTSVVTDSVNSKDFQLFTCTPFTKPTVPVPLNCLPETGGGHSTANHSGVGILPIGGGKKSDVMNTPPNAARPGEFECSTHVTFSDLNHPIPSVSPQKDSVDFDCTAATVSKSPSLPGPARVTASPNLLNDIESVLRETDEFSFHSALTSSVDSGVVPGPPKTPEKLLTSIPPTEIMKKKPSIMFEDFTQN